MATIPLSKNVIDAIVIDWRVGQMSQKDIADKHKVSKASVNKACKGITQDCKSIVTEGLQYKQSLAKHDDRIVTAVNAAIDKKLWYLEFFDDAAVTNVTEAMRTPCESQNDYRARAETISKGRTDVLGKAPETQVNIQNNTAITKIEHVIVRANNG